MTALTGGEPAAAPTRGRRPWWAPVVVVLAVLAVAAALVVGVRGLLGNPVRGTDAAGVTTLEGTFEPFECGTPCIGYVQDGARSVTVLLPAGCIAPAREARVRALGRRDPTQGKAVYRLTGCPSPT